MQYNRKQKMEHKNEGNKSYQLIDLYQKGHFFHTHQTFKLW